MLSHVVEGLAGDGTTQPPARGSAPKGSVVPSRSWMGASGRTRTLVSASARSLSTSAPANASTSSMRTPGRWGMTSRHASAAPDPSSVSRAAMTRKSRASSLVRATNQPMPPAEGARWSSAYSTPSRRAMTTAGSASGWPEGMARHSLVFVLCRPTRMNAVSRVVPAPSVKRRSSSS